MDDLEFKILQEFHKRVPNRLSIENFDSLFKSKYSSESMSDCFNKLVDEGKLLLLPPQPKNNLPQTKQYSLPADPSRPIKKIP